MPDHPPKCSAAWTPEERLRLIEWISRTTLDAISADNPAMPAVAKAPTFNLFHAIHALTTRTAEDLEIDRQALEKPFDPSKNRHEVYHRGTFYVAQT